MLSLSPSLLYEAFPSLSVNWMKNVGQWLETIKLRYVWNVWSVWRTDQIWWGQQREGSLTLTFGGKVFSSQCRLVSVKLRDWWRDLKWYTSSRHPTWGSRFRDKFTLFVSVEGLILCSVTTTCHAEGGRRSVAWPGCLLGWDMSGCEGPCSRSQIYFSS